jgi:hypothetical protein
MPTADVWQARTVIIVHHGRPVPTVAQLDSVLHEQAATRVHVEADEGRLVVGLQIVAGSLLDPVKCWSLALWRMESEVPVSPSFRACSPSFHRGWDP